MPAPLPMPTEEHRRAEALQQVVVWLQGKTEDYQQLLRIVASMAPHVAEPAPWYVHYLAAGAQGALPVMFAELAGKLAEVEAAKQAAKAAAEAVPGSLARAEAAAAAAAAEAAVGAPGPA